MQAVSELDFLVEYRVLQAGLHHTFFCMNNVDKESKVQMDKTVNKNGVGMKLKG